MGLEGLFPGGAWWITLADVVEPSLVLEEVRRALHRPATPTVTPAVTPAVTPTPTPSLSDLDDLLQVLGVAS